MTESDKSYRNSRGAALTEYAALLGLIAVVVIVPMMQLGREASGAFNQLSELVTSEVDAGSFSESFMMTASAPSPSFTGGGTESTTKNTEVPPKDGEEES